MEQQALAFNPKEYDEKILKTLPYYKDMIQQTIEVVKFGMDERELSWLDIGCGTGSLIEMALDQLPIKKIVMSDISSEMLELSRKRLMRFKTYIDFINIASQEICYIDEFDVVTSIQVHHYLHEEEREKAITNCYNALRKNGIYITFENYSPFSNEGIKNALERWERYQLNQGRTLSEVERHLSRFGEAFYPINIEKQLTLLKHIGFRNVEIFWVTYMQAGFWAKK